MRRLALFSILIISVCFIKAQNFVPNGGFENWTTSSYETLDNYVTEVGFAYFLLGSTTTFKSTDAQNGNFSVRMETKTNGSDTIFGFLTSGDFDRDNGYPYSQRPDSLIGYYKCDIQPGDTGYVVVRFSSLGTIFSFNVKSFVGTQNSWTRFAMPLNVPLTPDSMFFAAVASNAINEIGITPGSWLMLDNVSFTGTGITQGVLNGDFENWTPVNIENPDDWSPINLYASTQGQLSATKTSDSYAGNFALRLETIAFRDDTLGLITNGQFANDSIIGGHPFSIVFDTLIGYYKYSPVGLDTAAVGLTFTKNGNAIGRFYKALTARSTYGLFEVPFVLPQIPDTLRVDIVSSAEEDKVGSTLFIDELILKSIVTSLNVKNDLVQKVDIYPNPMSNQLSINLELNDEADFFLIDGMGREYWKKMNVLPGEVREIIDAEQLPSGMYFLRIIAGDVKAHYKVIKD